MDVFRRYLSSGCPCSRKLKPHMLPISIYKRTIQRYFNRMKYDYTLDACYRTNLKLLRFTCVTSRRIQRKWNDNRFIGKIAVDSYQNTIFVNFHLCFSLRRLMLLLFVPCCCQLYNISSINSNKSISNWKTCCVWLWAMCSTTNCLQITAAKTNHFLWAIGESPDSGFVSNDYQMQWPQPTNNKPTRIF